MLAPLLFAAASAAGTWPTWSVGWTPSEEAEVLDLLAAAGVPEAVHAARSAFGKEERQRSSIYTTVETILEPFADRRRRCRSDGTGGPGAGRSTRPGWSAEDNTLYLCAPAHDQRRLTPLFVSVVRQVVEHVYDRVALTHRPVWIRRC